jgi:hypothetical protein
MERTRASRAYVVSVLAASPKLSTRLQTQWQKKKQTREERQAAKRAKLDPASHKTAKDVMDENARKRKRELEAEAEAETAESSELDMDFEKEKPLQGLKLPVVKPKKQKTEKDASTDVDVVKQAAADNNEGPNAKAKTTAEKRRQKREQKKEKQALKQQKQESKKALQKEFSSGLGDAAETADGKEGGDDNEDDEDAEDAHEVLEEDRMDALDVSGLVEAPILTATTTPSSTNSNASTASVASAVSSTSSTSPPLNDGSLGKKESKPYKPDPQKQEAFRQRLAQKLEQMRASRKADGPDGRPARNRAELIESRRKKEAERKAAKKASRQLAKEDEERLKAEEQLARLRGGSGSPSLFPPRSATPENQLNLAFGKVAWKDGQQLDSGLGGFLESRKKKGKSDAKTALEAAERKKARINALDEAKRNDIQEKDLWLSAKKRAQGEKVFDNENMLKKSVKRQEKAKAKSKEEWKDRIVGVHRGKAMKQKKREENLRKRREEKGQKGKKKVKKPGKKVKRPGFEGTFKAR